MHLPKNRFKTVLFCAVFSVIAGIALNRIDGPALQAAETDLTLLGSVQAVATLRRLYPIFTDPAARAGMTLQQRQAVENEFQDQLQQIPMELLLPQMERYSVAYASQVDTYKDPRGFVKRLSQVAMNGIITPAVIENPREGTISFKPAVAHPGDMSRFSPTSKTIFAVFDSSAYRDKRVLVRWYHSDRGRVLLFQQFEIADGDSNYIWLENENGFATGSYRVEIYRVDEDVTLLSSGEYRVES